MNEVARHNQPLWDECAIQVMVETMRANSTISYSDAAEIAASAADALVAQRQPRLS